MFDWFWEFLYGISKSLLRLIDGLLSCINKLCGIEPVTIDGQETDFMTFFLRSEGVENGFKIASILALIVLVFFTIFRILMILSKEKQDMTPGQVCIKAFKSVGMFLFVPAIMIFTVYILNTFIQALYTATTNGNQSLGTFLFQAFSQDAITNQTMYDSVLSTPSGYLDTDLVETAIELSDFDFIFSWIAGICLLICVGNCLILFVDRAISIAVLFIVSPFSIASSVIDDGGRFKLWRDQVISKFLVGYGMILFLNVYCLLINVVAPSNVIFFDSNFLNNLFKLVIILGGGYASMKSMALIGNIISSGAGSRDLVDAALGAKAMSAAGFAAKPFKWAGSKAWKAATSKKGDKNKDEEKKSHDAEKSEDKQDDSSGEKLDKNPKFGDNEKGVNNALKNDGDKANNDGKNDNPEDNGKGEPLSETSNDSYRNSQSEMINEISESLEDNDKDEDENFYDDLK